MRVRNKELRARRHRKEQRVKELIKEAIAAKKPVGKAAAKPEAAKKAEPKKAAAPKAATAKKAPAKPKKALEPESPAE